jgi:hypothetical protein
MTTMAQQVNLLIDDLQPRMVVLSARQGLIGLAVVASVLVVVSLLGLLDIARSGEQRAALTQQIAVLADANTKLRASINSVAEPALAQRVADLQAQRQSRGVLVAALIGTTNERPAGFGRHFDQLAASVRPGLWLTGFDLGDGGNHIRLDGMTLDPVLVPRFLKSLGSAPQFVGHPFDTFELAAADSGALRFTITGPDVEAQ